METENHEVVDIDTDLLCPHIIMEVQNDPIRTESDQTTEEEPFSSYDYNITGAKAQFKLNAVEEQLRITIYRLDPDCVKYSKIHCTGCNIHLGSALDDLGNVFVHPLLSVLICKECFEYYSNGTFEKDDDGSEKYCRWCGQGGGVLCCSVCPMVFCKLCIRINVGDYKYADIRDNDEWKCFCCEPCQIMAHKVQCHEFARYVQTKMCMTACETTDIYMKTDFTKCCSEVQNRKRKSSFEDDPDYDPYAIEDSTPHIADRLKTYHKATFASENNMKVELAKPAPIEKSVVVAENGKDNNSGNKTMFISERSKTNVTNTKQPFTLSKNCNAPKPVFMVLESALKNNSQTIVAKDTLSQQKVSEKCKQPLISSTTSSQNSSNLVNSCTTINPKNPIWGFTKGPQKSIIISKSSCSTVSQPNDKIVITNSSQQNYKIVKPSSVPQTTIIKTNKNLLEANKNTMDENKNMSDVNTSKKPIEKAIIDMALANGAFGSSILQLEQTFKTSGIDDPGKLLDLYNSFQESLSNLLGELLNVKKEHIVANSRPGAYSKLVPFKYCQGPIPVRTFYSAQTTKSSSVTFSVRTAPNFSSTNAVNEKSAMDVSRKNN